MTNCPLHSRRSNGDARGRKKGRTRKNEAVVVIVMKKTVWLSFSFPLSISVCLFFVAAHLNAAHTAREGEFFPCAKAAPLPN